MVFEEKQDEFAGILDPTMAARNYTLRRFLPSAQLAPFVEHYWIVSWNLPDGTSYEAEVLPHPNLNLAFTRERGWITGVTTGKYTYEVKGAGAVFGVMFRPGGFRPFYRRAVSELLGTTLDARRVFPAATDAARLRLMSHRDTDRIIAHAETLLMGDGLPEADPNVATAARIVDTARENRGIVTVGALAKHSRVRERTLQHLFQHYVGVGPKWVIRLYRLVEAATVASADDAPNWSSVAYELGYADQSHFTNDFRRIVGRPPSDYARRARRR